MKEALDYISRSPHDMIPLQHERFFSHYPTQLQCVALEKTFENVMAFFRVTCAGKPTVGSHGTRQESSRRKRDSASVVHPLLEHA